MQRLELGRDRREGVDRAAAGACLGHGALHQVLGARAPVLKVDAVFLAKASVTGFMSSATDEP